jgi:hypothetical protein
VVVDMTAEVARMNCGLVRRVARTVHVADLGVVVGIDEEERKVEREAVEEWDVANGEGVAAEGLNRGYHLVVLEQSKL